MPVSLYVAASISGNLWQESNINPGIWQNLSAGDWVDLNKGYGIGQWTNTGGNQQGRLYQLYSWLSSNGYKLDDGGAQVDYILVENVWYSQQEAAAFSNLMEYLNSGSQDIPFLTHAWNIGWEGIHDGSWDLRVSYANTCYSYIAENYGNPSITTWVSGNRYLSENEILNNAVMFYRKLSGEAPPPQPGAAKKMSIWKMLRRLY